MSVHEVLREGGAQYGEADAQRGHHGKWQDLFTDMTSSSLAPCPLRFNPYEGMAR